MATGSFNLTKSSNNSSGSYIIGKIEWSSAKNIDGNYSSVTATLYCKKFNDSTILTTATSGTWSYALSINGSQISGTVKKDILTDWVAIATHTVSKVSHNADGTKAITISGSVTAPSVSSYAGLTSSGSKSVALDTIPRASSVAATNANIGSNTTITISRASSSFTHTLTYKFGSLAGTIATKTASTSIPWTVPTTFYAQIPKDKMGTCTITCTTYNGSTQVGTSTTSFYAIASENVCKPTLSPTYYDANSKTVALTGDNKKFVRYYSTAQLATGAAARNSATLASQKITCGSKASNASTASLPNVESATFAFVATDSRGYTTEQTINATLVNYVKLTCVLTKDSSTIDGTVTLTISGSFFNGSFGAKANSLNLYYRYKPNGGSYGSDVKITNIAKSGNTYTATVTVSGLDYKTGYVFEAYATDELMTATGTTSAVKVTPVFDWGENDFKFNVPVILPKSYYFDDEETGGHGGLDVNNSDIVGLNNLLFRDKSDGAGESIRFYKDGTNWDCLYVIDGVVYLTPNYPANTKQFVIFHPDNKPYYEAGDKVTVYSTYPGWVSGGSKEFYVSIPLSKPILASTISVSGSVVGRGINGYVLGSNTTRIDLAGGIGYSVEVVKQPDGLKLDIIYEAAQTSGVVNNTPINWYGEVTITFS